MIYILSIIAAIVLFILYKFFPKKKIFVYFCILLLLVFSISAFINSRKIAQEEITREQIEIMKRQEQIFIDWYAAYQKNIDRLDRNWQVYYDITETLKNAEVYEKITYNQLEDLENEVIDEQIKIHNLQPPPELEEDCKIILSEVIRKTQIYSDAQAKVVTSVKAAANPETAKDLAELNKKIKDITIREVPAGLFTAEEISQIREKISVPELPSKNLE